MSAESAFEIFGIPGIIIFCLGAIGYKIYQHYDIKFASNDFLNQNFASKTLNSTWEYEPGIPNISNALSADIYKRIYYASFILLFTLLFLRSFKHQCRRM